MALGPNPSLRGFLFEIRYKRHKATSSSGENREVIVLHVVPPSWHSAWGRCPSDSTIVMSLAIRTVPVVTMVVELMAIL